MSTWIITIPAEGPITAQPKPTKGGGLEALQGVVGGNIQIIPHLNKIDLRALCHRGLDPEVLQILGRGWQDCIAFCNEDGERDRQTANVPGTRLWATTLVRDGYVQATETGQVQMQDVLVGPIAIEVSSDSKVHSEWSHRKPPEPAIQDALRSGQMLAVGQRFYGMEPGQIEGTQFYACYGDAPALFFFYSNVSPAEAEAFTQTKITLGLFRQGPEAFFLLFRMPGFDAGEWGEAPFSIFKAHPEARELPKREPNAGWLFKALLIDSVTMTVRGMRACTMTPEFSQVLEDLLDEQRAHASTWNEQVYNRHINEVRARYPQVGQMIPDAEMVEPVGLSFAEARERRSGRRVHTGTKH